MNEPRKIRQEVEARIIDQAWKDQAYKQELLSNPKAIIEREFGTQFPADVNVQVLEENPTTIYLVVPLDPDISSMELSEEQLEAIAGGGGVWPWDKIVENADKVAKAFIDTADKVYGTAKDFGGEIYRRTQGGC
jgi:hypothetical protein